MLRILLAIDDDASIDDQTMVRSSLEGAIKALGTQHVIESVSMPTGIDNCREGDTVLVECFQKEAYFSLGDLLVRRGVIGKGQALSDSTDRYLHVTLTPAPIRSKLGTLFGATDWVDSELTQFALLSTWWLGKEEGHRRARLIRRLTQHELGHALGLIPEGREHSRERFGLHCTNVCVMRQGENPDKFLSLAEEEDEADVLFCSMCLDFLNARL